MTTIDAEPGSAAGNPGPPGRKGPIFMHPRNPATHSLRFRTALAFLFLLIAGCSPHPEGIISDGIRLYKGGDTLHALQRMEEGLLKSASRESFTAESLHSGDNVIYLLAPGEWASLYPRKARFPVPGRYRLASYENESGRAAFSDGLAIRLYDDSGRLQKEIPLAADRKREIKAIRLQEQSLLFFYDERLLVYDLGSDNITPLTREKISPPLAGASYQVKMYRSGGLLAVTAGMAGLYQMSIFDMGKSSPVLKNHKISTSKLLLKEESVTYIAGTAGQWVLARMSPGKKQVTEIMKFSDLSDVEFSPDFIMFENKEGIWMADYSGRKALRVPFPFELAGVCGDYILIRTGNLIHMVSPKNLHDRLVFIQAEIPALFEKNN